MSGGDETPHRMPIACGALGDFDAERVARIATGFDAELHEVHRDQRSALWLDRKPIAWQGDGERGLCWPERLPVRAEGARSWREAATAGALGLVIEGERRAVHASVSGIGPLYWLREGSAAYFATAIDPLARSGAGKLSPDWESWAQIIVLGYACGDGTPFAEIRRLNPLALLSANDATVVASAGELAWAEVEPDGSPDVPERIVAALREEIAALDPETPVLCPLSGGWDSRLLLSLIVERRLEVEAWTVDPDWGNDQDERFAAAVASRLGVPHRIVPPDQRSFEEELEEAAERVEYESMVHLALARLGIALPRSGALVIDGLGGDVFSHSRYVTPEVVETADWRTQVELMLDRFAPPAAGLPLFEDRTWRWLADTARAAYARESERFANHPSAPILSLYWNRTRRGVSTSPVRLFGTRQPIGVPLLADDVVRTALSVPPSTKLDSRFYRQALAIVSGEVAELPSTNDDLPEPERTRPRRRRSPEARLAYISWLRRSPLQPWFGTQLAQAVAESRLGPVIRRSWWRVSRIQGLSTLTLWLDRYEDVLAYPALRARPPWDE